MLGALGDLNAVRKTRGLAPIEIGIGVHTGKLMLGTIGGSKRLDMAIIGDVVNLASRIEGLTKLYGTTMVISEVTHAHLRQTNRFEMRLLDRVVPKGKTMALDVFEVLDGQSPASRETKLANRVEFARAYLLLRTGHIKDALSAFTRLAPNDPAAGLHARRLSEVLTHGIPSGWDGVHHLDVK